MKTTVYNPTLRNFANFVRVFSPYDYVRSGGSTSNGHIQGQANGNGQPTQFTASLPVDVWADENTFTIQAYLPGVKPEEVEITMEGEELTIRGHFAKSQEGVKFARRELFHGPFERRLTINTPVNVEGISAEYENGVLTLTVPKAEEVKPKQIKVVAK